MVGKSMGSGARLLGTVSDLNVSDVICPLHVVVGGLHVGFLELCLARC